MRRTLRLNKIFLVLLFSFVGTFGQIALQQAVSEFDKGNYESASILLEKYHADNPFDKTAFQYLVNSYLQIGKVGKAKKLLQKGIVDYPNDFELRLILAKLFFNNMEVDSAQEHLKFLEKQKYKITEVRDLLGKSFFNKAVVNVQNNENKAALENLKLAKNYGVENPEFFALKSQIHLNRKENTKAEKVIDEGLTLFPNEEILLITKSVLLINRKEYGQATEIVEPMWKKNNKDLKLGLQLALLYRAKNKIQESMNVYDTLLKIYPNEKQIYTDMLGYFKLTKKYENIRAIYEEMKIKFPNDKTLDFEIAQTYKEEGSDSLAINKLKEIIAAEGYSEKVTLELAELFSRNNLQEEAITIYENSINAKKFNENIFINLSNLYKKKDDFELAKSTLSKFKEAYQNSFLPDYYLGRLYKSKNNFKIAKDYFKEGLAISKNAVLLFELAQTSEKIETVEDTKPIYSEVFEMAIYKLEEQQRLIKSKINANEKDFGYSSEEEKTTNNPDSLQNIIETSFYYLLNNSKQYEIENILSPILKEFPQSAILLYFKGEIFYKRKDFQRAEKFYIQALRTNSAFEEAHLKLAEIYENRDEISKANLSYKRILGINPNSKIAYKSLIKLAQKENALTELGNEWLKIYSVNPENKILKEFLIEVYHKTGRFSEVRELLNQE